MDIDQAVKKIGNGNKSYPYTSTETLVLGSFMTAHGEDYTSTKLEGWSLQKNHPQIAAIPPNFRSDAAYIYRLHRDHKDELLEALRISHLCDYYTPHPTMMRRAYREWASQQTR
ncbi:hypothetical protein [Celeribacter neptunius]|uniref:Uncharacterized protein n=1 Tax=Celeribacter neptunius TaxID=588602 RepID=A0A1I3PEX7_9RHOB|nr:hypothetical protein [Celeribacter neptunius]SFJ20214.1 hypothetical protein SAMN04487991_1660 [Celeribacter neptunius]